MHISCIALLASFNAPLSAEEVNQQPYWQNYSTTSAIYAQSTSATASKVDEGYDVSSQNIMVDTYTLGRLGNSTYFGFVEAIFGKLDDTSNGSHKSPYGNDLMQIRGMMSQQWRINKSFSMGWNYYGIDRNLKHVADGKFGYSFDSLGVIANYQWNKWTFMPQLNYVFNGDMGKDGLASSIGLGSSDFDGFFFLPVVRRQLSNSGSYFTLMPEYFAGYGDHDTEVKYMKWQLRVGAPIGESKKWWINGRFEHTSYQKYDYFGIDINPSQDTAVSVGIQYNW
ncbi:hypothetical protein L4D09_09020 [Photobacterium makurazakiensis]|uniref:hypothetical protein n=1 Tax=Photobacterium makurazakiensis TaxID=2910234 RepID=UPI003D0E009E